MSLPIVVVFGPTGAVGSSTARTAQRLGAKVYLALRNTRAPIPGLDYEQEKKAGYERVQADLTQPKTIEAAVLKSGASHAFIYLIHGANDHIKGSVEALKRAGIKFVVFLSSASVPANRLQAKPDDYSAYAHSQAELTVEEAFGTTGYVAVRPAFFATNVAWWSGMISKGNVEVAYPDAVFDWLSPDDIGKVCGTVLLRGYQTVEDAGGNNFIQICGPKLISLRETLSIFGKVVKKDLNVTEVNEEDGVKALVENGLPKFIAEPMLRTVGCRYRADQEEDPIYNETAYNKAVASLRNFVEQPTELEEWAEANKGIICGDHSL